MTLGIGVKILKYVPASRERKLRRELKRVDRLYQPIFDQAKQEKKDLDELRRIDNEWDMERRFVHEELESLLSWKLVAKADRLRLSHPRLPYDADEDEYWTRGTYTAKWYLTNKGHSQIRDAIRKERKARSDLFLPWAAAVIGLIGALTGFFAVVLR